MYCEDSSPALTNCEFSGNKTDTSYSDGGGGGMYCTGSSPSLVHCTFSGNQAQWGGGGMCCYSFSSPTLTNCTFSGNQANTYSGGGIYCEDSSPTLTNCIIAFSTLGEAVYYRRWSSGSPTLTCCDIYGNEGGDWVDRIAGQYGVDGNFSEDPLFCDMTSDDFTLASNSPCLPDSNDCHVLIGAHGEGCPDSPAEATSWDSMKAMHRWRCERRAQ